MKRLFVVLALLTLCASVASAAPYLGSFKKVWTFDNGAEGWTLNGSAAWQSWSGVGGSGAIYAPDVYNAKLNDAGQEWQNLLAGYVGKGFVFQADIFVGAANYLQGSGISVERNGDFKGPWATGTAAGNQGMAGNDKSWYNSTKNKSWGLAVGQWTTVQIDYGWTTPGKILMSYTACAGNGAGWAAGSWQEIIAPSHNADVHPSDIFHTLSLGGGVNGAQTGWSQAVFDNVKLQYVPEPGSLLALGTGLVGLLGVIRRRK